MLELCLVGMNPTTELNELLNPPTKAELNRMTEQERDWADRLLKDIAYTIRRILKKLYDGYGNIIGALNVVIEASKANRKTRKRAPKSKEKLAKTKIQSNRRQATC